MPDQTVNFSEILLADLEGMITKLSASVGEAQRRLDEAALASQGKLEADFPKLAEIGYRVPWYAIPEADLEVKVAVHLEEKKQQDGSTKSGWFFSPYNAKYQQAYTFIADGASNLKLKIVPLPPPALVIPPAPEPPPAPPARRPR